VDEHGMETPWDIPPVVENLLKYFNSPEMQGEFSYGCKAVVCEDKTEFPKCQVDRAFLDKDVVILMVYLYQDSVASMKRYGDEFLSMFWTNIEQGKAVMSEFCKSDDEHCDDDD
jgi:hypothetical protein